LLRDGTNYVPSVLAKVFRESDQRVLEWDVIVAVVDRLPLLNADKPLKSLVIPRGDGSSLSLSQLRNPLGYEGISLAALDSLSAAPDLWDAKNVSKETSSMTVQQRCCISFSFLQKNTHDPTKAPHVLRTVQLPVANTLFKNGKTSTLLAQRWAWDSDAAESARWSRSKQTELPYQTIHMPHEMQDESFKVENHLRSRLKQITPPRVISAAVGNIVLNIHAGKKTEESVPASLELENAINTQIGAGMIERQHVDVWALIRPRSVPDVAATDDSKALQFDSLEQDGIPGPRLLKVLSGGGGWGEKQGLLALDPDSEYAGSTPENLQVFDDARDAGETSSPIFEKFVEPGDSVTFFANEPLAPSDFREGVIPTNQRKLGMAAVRFVAPQQQKFVDFGSLPSTMDAMPASSDDSAKPAVPSFAIAIIGYFGMLSEQGMSLRVSSSSLDSNEC